MSVHEYEDDSDNSSAYLDWYTESIPSSLPAARASLEPDVHRRDYESDSSHELAQGASNRRPSLLTASFNDNIFTDDENHSEIEDSMIVSDDDEDEETDEEDDTIGPPHPLTASDTERTANLSSLKKEPQRFINNVTPNSRTGSMQKGERELAALFAEDKPWRRGRGSTPWKMRHRKFQSLDDASKLNLEEETDHYNKRNKGGIFRKRNPSNGTAVDHSASLNSPQRSFKEDCKSEEEEEEEDCSEEDEVSVQSSQLSDIDLDEKLDWNLLSPLPHSFLGSNFDFHSSMAQYLEDTLQSTTMTLKDGNQFAIEHSLFLRAILQLLEERQVHTLEEIENIEDCAILKKGPLRKFSHAVGRPVWKVKYAEVRRGNFSYYEDSAADSSAARKTIPLSNCVCQKVRKKGAFVFELLPDNSPRRLFMCSSEEERQAWMRVIEEARRKRRSPINLEPYQWYIDTYNDLQINLRSASSKNEFLSHFGQLEELKLQLPIQWVLDEGLGKIENDSALQKTRSSFNSNIIGFFDFLQKHAFVINDCVINSGSLHGPERIIGVLSRCILEYHHSSSEEQKGDDNFSKQKSLLTEIQAVSHARDILNSMWQSRVRDDILYTLQNMCQTEGDLVVVQPISANPEISVNVSYSNEENIVYINTPHPVEVDITQEMSGWVDTRSKSPLWRNRFCVVSEGVLTYYEHDSPRPHGLKGQMVLVGASISVVNEEEKEETPLYILEILPKHIKEFSRQLSFASEDELVIWKDAIQQAIDACSSSSANDVSPPCSPSGRRRKRRSMQGRRLIKGMEGGGRIMKTAANGSLKVIKGASEGSLKAIKGASEGSLKVIKKMARQKNADDSSRQTTLSAFDEHDDNERMPILPEALEETPSIQVKIESCCDYKIMTSRATGVEKYDIWATAHTSIYKLFQISNPNGKLTNVEELMEMSFST